MHFPDTLASRMGKLKFAALQTACNARKSRNCRALPLVGVGNALVCACCVCTIIYKADASTIGTPPSRSSTAAEIVAEVVAQVDKRHLEQVGNVEFRAAPLHCRLCLAGLGPIKYEATSGPCCSFLERPIDDGLHGRCAPGHPTASEDLLRTDEDACCHGHLGRIHRCRGTEKAAVRADRVKITGLKPYIHVEYNFYVS